MICWGIDFEVGYNGIMAKPCILHFRNLIFQKVIYTRSLCYNQVKQKNVFITELPFTDLFNWRSYFVPLFYTNIYKLKRCLAVTSAMPTQIVVFYACSLFAYVICLEIIYIVPLLRCMYTMRNAPRGGMEGLTLQI